MWEGTYLASHKTTSGGKKASEERSPKPAGRRREVTGLITAASTILLVLALFSYNAQEPDNLVGPVGKGVAGLLVEAVGYAAWVLPIELAMTTYRLFRGRRALLGLATAASTLVFVLIGCALVHLLLMGTTVYGGHLPGGALGELLGALLQSMLGLAGAYVVSVTILLITLVLRTRMSISAAMAKFSDAAQKGVNKTKDGAGAVLDAWKEARDLDRQEQGYDDFDEETEGDESGDDTLNEAETDDRQTPAMPAKPRRKKKKKAEAPAEPPEDTEEESPEEDEDLDELEDDEEEEEALPPPKKAPKKPAKKAPAKKAPAEDAGPRIIAPKETPSRPPGIAPIETAKGDFQMPSLELLETPDDGGIRVDPAVLRANAKRLIEKLESYGVKGRIDEIHPGPVVTMYELEPQSGTKISKIAGLENDLALALAARSVRIVAPIPGKARVGIELPNEDRQTVYLREILEDARWNKQKGALPLALGKDIAGQPVYSDLSKMPHLLVAGATGAGKSVGLNVMLASLLYRKTPEEVRMLMIDPKVVELKSFDGIPHMLLPVVTDMNKAALALRWAVDEMERRYQLFADAGARNISSYNKRIDRVIAGDLAVEKVVPKAAGMVRGVDENGTVSYAPPIDGEEPSEIPIPDKLPYVVVVVDEFADLMMVAAKDVEACIARLAQKARAAGIHVILATQRPSVDVITGMIKANFPSRMAFKVSQREDSKTILGRVGAQNLLGRGDMLMLPPGSSELTRVHSAFISEDEVQEMCDFLRTQGKPVYDERILAPREEGDAGGGQKTDDPLYDKAVAVVAQAGYCSISHLQRQLSIGYNKAAKLVDRMEADGVVGPASKKAGGRREVLISPI